MKYIFIPLFILVVVGLLLIVFLKNKQSTANQVKYASGVLIVGFKPEVSEQSCKKILESNNLQYRIFSTTEEYVVKNGRVYIVNVPIGKEEQFKQDLLKISEIRYIDFDYIATIQNDTR